VSLLFCLRFISFFYCLRPVSCVPNVASVPSVFLLSSSCVVCAQCCQCPFCVFIVFVLCRVCSMLPVSLLFCLRFIVFFIVFVLCRVCPMLPVSLLCFYCLRPVSCVLNGASVPSVLSKVY
jgi:hypothetical protein